MKKNKIKILSIRIEQKFDESPDISLMGKYSDDFNEPYAIIAVGKNKGRFVADLADDEEFSNYRQRHYNLFIPPYENYKGEKESEIKKYCLQDYQRMEDLQTQKWYFMGIIAKAEIILNGNLIQTIHSGGLWGVESDMEKEQLEEIGAEQLHELKSELKTIGFSERQIKFALKGCETQKIS